MAGKSINASDMVRIAKLVEKLVNDRQITVTDTIVGDLQVTYNLCTTTTPDSSHIFWYGPVSICTDSVVTIGAGAIAEIEDNIITMERV